MKHSRTYIEEFCVCILVCAVKRLREGMMKRAGDGLNFSAAAGYYSATARAINNFSRTNAGRALPFDRLNTVCVHTEGAEREGGMKRTGRPALTLSSG